MRIGARRIASENEYYWRVTQFLAPFYTMIARRDDKSAIAGHAWTPIDDHNTWTFTFHWNPDYPLGDASEFDSAAVNVPVYDDGSYKPLNNRSNNYGIERDVQKLYSSTGIQGIGLQDSAIQETMGPIVDRSREILGRATPRSSPSASCSWPRPATCARRGELALPSQPNSIASARSASCCRGRSILRKAPATR